MSTYQVAFPTSLSLSLSPSLSCHGSADEWNLRKPLQECSLRIERRGDVLLIVLTFKKEGEKGSNLFALCKVDLVGAPEHGMDHYVKPVADSSRYFAIRVTDENGGREAVIGLGFREREEAADFSQCLINYYNAIVRERLNGKQWKSVATTTTTTY